MHEMPLSRRLQTPSFGPTHSSKTYCRYILGEVRRGANFRVARSIPEDSGSLRNSCSKFQINEFLGACLRNLAKAILASNRYSKAGALGSVGAAKARGSRNRKIGVAREQRVLGVIEATREQRVLGEAEMGKWG